VSGSPSRGYYLVKVVTWLFMGTVALLTITGAVLTLLYSSPRSAAQVRIEVMGGKCHYGKVGNFVWYNEHYQHSLDMSPACGLVGVSKITGAHGYTHLGWRLAYVDMGSARTNAVFPMLDAEQESVLPDGSKCNAATWRGCIGRGVGVQTARGISAGLIAERDVGGGRLGAELGMYVYEGRWRVAVAPEAPSQFQGYSEDWHGLQATPYIGATARYGYAMAMVRSYLRIRAAEHGCVGCSGVAGKTATQALVGLSVPF
jgi:hypothetical protein